MQIQKGSDMSRKTGWILALLVGMSSIVGGCDNAQKQATEAAINAAQAAVNAVQDEAEKYVPDQLQAAKNAVQSAKDSVNKGDYQAALNAARDAADKAKDLANSAAAKRDEWTKEWAQTNTSMPKSLDEIKAKLNAYSHGSRMPEGMDQKALDDAKAQYEKLKQGWADATASATHGNMGDAISKTTDLKATIAKLKEMLGIKQ
jgi:ATP-dependent Clp protease ATP-binding subunit ClpA